MDEVGVRLPVGPQNKKSVPLTGTDFLFAIPYLFKVW